MRSHRTCATVAATALLCAATWPASASAQAAGHCVTARTTSRTAFFKARIDNNCNRTVHVSWCERGSCGSRRGFYTDLSSIRPGQSIPADTVGQGITFAACIYPQSARYVSGGRYACR